MTEAAILVELGRLWLIAGGLVAAVFLIFGIDRIDQDARGAYVFRPLIVPGILLLWPLVLWRWWVLETGPDDPGPRYKPVRAAHGTAAVALCLVVIGTVVLGITSRQQWPAERAPERLAVPSESGR